MQHPDSDTLKGRLPFRLATTSYILPDAILPNLRFLAPLVDEVELVFFESRSADSLPSKDAVRDIAGIGAEASLTFNVHLPTDVFLGHADRDRRKQARDTLLAFYERTRSLDPSLYILHLEKPPLATPGRAALDPWRTRLREDLEQIFSAGLPASLTAIENIDYPFAEVADLAEIFETKICLDIGHLLRQNSDIARELALYASRIAMLHLHGLHQGKDHRSIAEMPGDTWALVTQFLQGYRHGVSLEVFSRTDLETSLNRMKELLACPA